MSILLAPTWQVFAMGLLRVGLGHREAAGRVAALGKQPTVGGGGHRLGERSPWMPLPRGTGLRASHAGRREDAGTGGGTACL